MCSPQSAIPPRLNSRPSSSHNLVIRQLQLARNPIGRLVLLRRSEADLAKLADRIVVLVKANAKGVNAETIKRTLKIERKELARPLAMALGSKKITKRGKKRATMYFRT